MERGQLDPQWYAALLEEYKSLRAEAVTARDAQLSVLRLAVPLAAALIGVGVSLKSGEDSLDGLLAGILLSMALPTIVALTFELWLGQVQRTVRLGSVVAGIERRLADLFRSGTLGAGLPGPPMGWEQWLRRPDDSAGLSRQQRESTTTAVATFAFLFLAAGGSFGLGLSFLFSRASDTAAYVAIGIGVFVFGYLFVRAFYAIRGLDDRGQPPSPHDVWPEEGEWRKRERD